MGVAYEGHMARSCSTCHGHWMHPEKSYAVLGTRSKSLEGGNGKAPSCLYNGIYLLKMSNRLRRANNRKVEKSGKSDWFLFVCSYFSKHKTLAFIWRSVTDNIMKVVYIISKPILKCQNSQYKYETSQIKYQIVNVIAKSETIYIKTHATNI